MESNQRNKYIPLIIAVSVIAGILTGTFYSKRFSNERKEYSANFTTSNKLNGLLRITAWNRNRGSLQTSSSASGS